MVSVDEEMHQIMLANVSPEKPGEIIKFVNRNFGIVRYVRNDFDIRTLVWKTEADVR